LLRYLAAFHPLPLTRPLSEPKNHFLTAASRLSRNDGAGRPIRRGYVWAFGIIKKRGSPTRRVGFTVCGKTQRVVIPRHASCRGISLFSGFKYREIPHFVRFTENVLSERSDSERHFFPHPNFYTWKVCTLPSQSGRSANEDREQ
jgi:hypothetical protein